MKNSTQKNGESTWKKNEEGKGMNSGKEMSKNSSQQNREGSMNNSSRTDGQSQWKQNEEDKKMSKSSSRQGSNEGTERSQKETTYSKETTRSNDTIDKKRNV